MAFKCQRGWKAFEFRRGCRWPCFDPDLTKTARSVSESLVTSSLAAIQRPGHQSDKSFRPSDEARYGSFQVKPKWHFWSLFTKGRTRICIPLLNRELKQTTTAGSSQKRHQTKGWSAETLAVHVRFESLYSSYPSSAKQQREMTKLYVFWRTWTSVAKFSHLFSELNAFAACLVWASFSLHWTDLHSCEIRRYNINTFNFYKRRCRRHCKNSLLIFDEAFYGLGNRTISPSYKRKRKNFDQLVLHGDTTRKPVKYNSII